MAKSTTENPADKAKEEEVVVATVAPAAAEEAGIERASVVNATHVRYVGGAHVATITAAQWREAGVEGQGKVVFDKRKFRGDRIAIVDVTPAALEYFDRFDERFALVDENGKRV